MARFLALAACSLLVGCASWWPQGGPPRTIPVQDIINQLKYEIALHESTSPAAGDQPRPTTSPCTGEIDLTIQSVRIALTTINTDSASVDAGAELPIGNISLGPSFSRSREHINSQTLTFNLYVDPSAPTPDPRLISRRDIWEGTPITTALTDLRRSLEQADHDRPCLTFETASPQAPANTFSFGFVVVETAKNSGKFKFLVFSIGGGQTAQRRAENTITVTFRGSGTSFTSQ